jgi:hypothetical protein
MTAPRILSLLAVTLVPVAASGETLPDFDPHTCTWRATHIVVVEGTKVVESWKGDLKVGQELPTGADRFAKLPVPDFYPEREGAKPPVVSGKTRVLFMAYLPVWDDVAKKPDWTEADSAGRTFNAVTAVASVAWLEGDKVYGVSQYINPGPLVLFDHGTRAGLKQTVDLGLALRGQFEAARVEKETGPRAERLAVLLPTLSAYERYWAALDVLDEIGKCGRTAVPYLFAWATEPTDKYRYAALDTLASLGDDAADAIIRLLDQECGAWTPDPIGHVGRMSAVLSTVHRMRLSAKNRDRVRDHAGLKSLDQAIEDRPPGFVQPDTELARAVATLKELRAGRFKPAE